MESVKTIQIPEGYIIDKEASTDSEIVLKPKSHDDVPAKSWEDYVKKMKGKPSVYVDYYDKIVESVFKSVQPWPLEFADKELLQAYLAYGKLIKLRKDWIKSWNPDWTNGHQAKFVIMVEGTTIACGINYVVSSYMSFPTKEMCPEFLDTFRNLLEIAKPLL